MINLSDQQTKIVCAPLGEPMQALAAAGSGKTRVLTERVRYILESTQKEGVIALTFTNKAAEEMRNRLDGIEELEDRCWIGTIHSFAQRILEQYAHTIGLPAELHIYERDQDRKTIFIQSLRDDGIDIDEYLNVAGGHDKKKREQVIQNYLNAFSEIKRECAPDDTPLDKYDDNDDFWLKYKRYREALLNSGGIDFDDILVYALRILVEKPWCAKIYRTKYKHICVDEAQDLNKLQYEFIKALSGSEIKGLLMVGDPNQMIYGFNGSSHLFLTKHFVDDFNPLQLELKENYRSSKAVIQIANKLKPGSQVETQYVAPGLVEFNIFKDEQEEAEWICEKIQALIGTVADKTEKIEGEISSRNMVILARNRFVFGALEEKLSEYSIPYSLKKGERQAEPGSILGKVLDLAIRIKVNPKDWIAGDKLCATLKVSSPDTWGSQNILSALSEKTLSSDVIFADAQSKLLGSIQSLNIDQPKIPKLYNNFTEIIKGLDVNKERNKEGELERSQRELQEFYKHWKTFRKKGLGESLTAFRNAMALGQLFDEANTDGLTLSTVHTMMGLEKDIVFLMGMCEGVFPDYRAQSQKELDEELNNVFVAVTRSRRWLYISYPEKRKMPWGSIKYQIPSRFFNDMKT